MTQLNRDTQPAPNFDGLEPDEKILLAGMASGMQSALVDGVDPDQDEASAEFNLLVADEIRESEDQDLVTASPAPDVAEGT